jgi:hypothetical protein
MEISRFVSPELGISFLFASKLFYEYDGSQRLDAMSKIIRTGNLVCLRDAEDSLEIVEPAEGCIEFYPYEEWEKLENSFGTGAKAYATDSNEEFPEGKWDFIIRGMKESLPKENLYFIRYTCNACAP